MCALTVTNISGLTALRYFGIAQSRYMRSMERLASGQRIVRAADDPAGLAISERMRAQIRGLKQASRNAQDGISLLQTAEGALSSVHEIIHRLNEIAVQAATETYSDEDRRALQNEFSQLVEEIDVIFGRSNFNTIPLFDENSSGLKIQVGANSGQHMKLQLPALSAGALNLVDEEGEVLDITDPDLAASAITTISEALSKVSAARSTIGAQMNRLEHTIENLENQRLNLIDAESRIRDVDMAEEIMNFTRSQIQMQAALAVMVQANVNQQMLFKLLFSF